MRQFYFMNVYFLFQLRFAVHEMELLQLISVNAVNDLESRMQNEIAAIELDPPRVNWKCWL